MYLGEDPNRLNEQWLLARNLGIVYPRELSPEQAKSEGFISVTDYKKIKDKLPFISVDPRTGKQTNVSMGRERFVASVISPAIDTVAAPVEGILTFTRNVSFISLALILGVGGYLLFSSRKK